MMRLVISILVLLCGLVGFYGAAVAEDVVPRTIIALYKGPEVRDSFIHTIAEMPLNQLGLTVEYHDISEPLPDIIHRKDVRGVITWFYNDSGLDAGTYLKWADAAVEAGKKFVIIESLGISETKQFQEEAMLADRFLSHLGIKIVNLWADRPIEGIFDYKMPELFLTNKPFEWVKPSYQVVRADSPDMHVHLSIHLPSSPKKDSDLVITGPKGGYLSANYALHGNGDVMQWRIDPFLFFRLAYATEDVPKPDTTTLDGRRIYYSTIDGDGWNNVTQLQEYNGKNILSPQVVMERAILPYPDLPVMVAPIAGYIDPQWFGTDEGRLLLRELWEIPWVEAGSHTYSHPYDWKFFKGGDPNAEIPYLPLFRDKTWKPTSEAIIAVKNSPPLKDYSLPRAFAVEPFDLHKEIEGSIKTVSAFLPKGKHIEVLAWSGNCVPWEMAVHLTRVAKVQNINGGDTRFDPEYPYYASVAPIGRQVGKERQIYVSTSNENTYTDLWTQNYHAFRYLRKTLDNSETPLRLKPFTIYYHMYSGERDASLNSLRSNLDYARTQDIIPITVSDFSHIAEGFYDTRFVALGHDRWRVENRGALSTIRFDQGALQAVDFDHSQGVIGQRRFQGSLYVALDPAIAQPILALKYDDRTFAQPLDKTTYLIESRWVVSHLTQASGKVKFEAQGYGDGEMVWQVSSPGRYRATFGGKSVDAVVGDDRLLTLTLKTSAATPVFVMVAKVGP